MPSFADSDYGACCNTTFAPLGLVMPAHVLCRWSGSPPVAQVCGAGLDPDGVTGATYSGTQPSHGTYGHAGRPVLVAAGGAVDEHRANDERSDT